ncbi:hypothetical protein [Micromonospora zhanjiangensis]|uniref:Uncharacterized protein n=1 Tax=Micromonospora zhanjiangensis TaxID=1522057 RepID=A0ABV8KEU9_9ACTN
MPWSHRDRSAQPVPLAPAHRPVWRRLRRYCSCGLRWSTCPDRRAAGPTAAARRANGGRW